MRFSSRSDAARLLRSSSMGVGDRHSRRVLIDKARFAKAVNSAAEASHEPRIGGLSLDELDDAFSAWDENDAGARKPTHAQLTQASSLTAETRVGRKPLAARTPPPPPSEAAPADDSTDDPPTLERCPTPNEPRHRSRPASIPPSDPALKLFDPVSMHDIVLARARTIDDPLTTRLLAEIARTDAMDDRRSGLMFLPTAGIVDRAREVVGGDLADLIVTDPESSLPDGNRPLGPEDELRARRRATRRLMGGPKDEPFRKK